eukprot:TRINITY_DN189_c0_g1_i1.p1 TRINITY_DN189_c0_g1~~TRINITY_DN189_c0_g1_i1.p1  ORF type:complete len:115 (-),score=30.84 TRINITY_DN189_c0_g1_i1:66-410(-)
MFVMWILTSCLLSWSCNLGFFHGVNEQYGGEFHNDMVNDRSFVLAFGLHPWCPQNHWSHTKQFKRETIEVLKMWLHDQYDEDELDGFDINMLPIEVIWRVLKWMARIPEAELIQ